MGTTLNRAKLLRGKGHPRSDAMMPQLKRFGFSAVGILVGLSSASVAYHLVPLIWVIVSSAETVDDLQVAWFPVRIWAAMIVARLSGSWALELLLQRWGRKREITEGTG